MMVGANIVPDDDEEEEVEQRDEQYHDASIAALSTTTTMMMTTTTTRNASLVNQEFGRNIMLPKAGRSLLDDDDIDYEVTTECIETSLRKEHRQQQQQSSSRRRRQRRWERRKLHSLDDHIVDVRYDGGEEKRMNNGASPPSFNKLPPGTAFSRFVTSPHPNSSNATILQHHRHDEDDSIEPTTILRRVQSTGDLADPHRNTAGTSAPGVVATGSDYCPGSPFSAIMDDVSGWLATPTSNGDPFRAMVDFSALQMPTLFSFDAGDENHNHEGTYHATTRSQQHFQVATWDQVLMRHAPGGVLIVLAAVTMHPLLCVAALVAVGASAVTTWRSSSTSIPSSSHGPTDATNPPNSIPTDVVVDGSESESNSSVGPLAMAGAKQHQQQRNPTSTLGEKESWLLRNDVAFQLAWIELMYPPLDTLLLANVGGFVGIRDVAELFQVFYADNAPFSFQAFQEKRGDLNVTYGPWEHVAVGHNQSESSLSFLPVSTVKSHRPNSFHSLVTRQLTFEAKTNNNYVGPAFACTTKRQRFLLVNPNLAVLESEAAVSNVPYGDRFRIVDRWVFQMAGGNDNGGLQIASYMCHVKLTGSCPFASQIRLQSSKTLTDVANAWIAMAREALKITEEQHEQERRQHQLLLLEGVEIVQSSLGQVMLVNA